MKGELIMFEENNNGYNEEQNNEYNYNGEQSNQNNEYNYNGGQNNGYNYNQNFSSQGNNQNNPKKKNRVPLAIAIAVITLLVILSCGIGIVALVTDDGDVTNKLTSNQKTTEKETYNSIGSTNSSSTSNSNGEVTVTDVSGVVSNTMPSVVSITSKTLVESNGYSSIYDYYFGGGNKSQKYEQEAAGSGIIVDQTDSELLIVTNNHVVENSDSLRIQFDGMDTKNAVEGYIKGTDSTADVAVVAVKLKDIPKDTLNTIKKATLGDSDTVSVGEGVVAIGNALGYGQSVTTGVISAKDREVTVQEKKMKLLQTDAAINGGNSGGALLNAKGEVIGINVAKYSSDGTSSASVEGMGFAIPISSVKSIIGNLETKETRTKVSDSEKGYLGIKSKYDVTSDISEMYSMPTGVYVFDIVKGGPAEKAGIQKGDIITKFDGQTVESYDSLQSIMQYYKAGEKVKVTIASAEGREYKEKEVTVTLASSKDVGYNESETASNN